MDHGYLGEYVHQPFAFFAPLREKDVRVVPLGANAQLRGIKNITDY